VQGQGGAVQGCASDELNSRPPQVSWDCQEELFRADVENADDVRLSVRLFRTCIKEKQQFCAEVAPGNARAKDCLEQSRSKPGFGDECKCALPRCPAPLAPSPAAQAHKSAKASALEPRAETGGCLTSHPSLAGACSRR